MDTLLTDDLHSGVPNFLSLGLQGYAPVMFIIGALAMLQSVFGKLQSFLHDHFIATISVKDSNEAYEMLLAWASSRELHVSARSIIARAGVKWDFEDGLSQKRKKPLCYSPWNASFLFWFKGKMLYYQTQIITTVMHQEEIITISCFGRSGKILRDLIEQCRDEYLRQTKDKIAVFKNYGNHWRKTSTKDKRPLSTVIMCKSQKKELVDDLTEFLNPETQNWYTQRSIPYRRGYLLFGPPGTGKSSLILALASAFDYDIRAISIPSVDDNKLDELFRNLPARCIVLLEDIDAIETNRSQNPQKSGEKQENLSLSGLLNTLDGVASQDGRILFMTTNHIDKLDDALIRPGRIDKKLEIKFADSDVIEDLFLFFYSHNKHSGIAENTSNLMMRPSRKLDTGERNPRTWIYPVEYLWKFMFGRRDNCSARKNETKTSTKRNGDHVMRLQRQGTAPDPISQLAIDFAAKFPRPKFSTAQIMSFLLEYKHSPEHALEKVGDWIQRTAKDERVASQTPAPRQEKPEREGDVLWMKKYKRNDWSASSSSSPRSSANQPCSASTSGTFFSSHDNASVLSDSVTESNNSAEEFETKTNPRIWDTEKGISATCSAHNVTDLRDCVEETLNILEQAGALKKVVFVRTSMDETTALGHGIEVGAKTEAIQPNSHLATSLTAGSTFFPSNSLKSNFAITSSTSPFVFNGSLNAGADPQTRTSTPVPPCTVLKPLPRSKSRINLCDLATAADLSFPKDDGFTRKKAQVNNIHGERSLWRSNLPSEKSNMGSAIADRNSGLTPNEEGNKAKCVQGEILIGLDHEGDCFLESVQPLENSSSMKNSGNGQLVGSDRGKTKNATQLRLTIPNPPPNSPCEPMVCPSRALTPPLSAIGVAVGAVTCVSSFPSVKNHRDETYSIVKAMLSERDLRPLIHRGDGYMFDLAMARVWTIGDKFTMHDAIDETLHAIRNLALPPSEDDLLEIYDQFKDHLSIYNEEVVKQTGWPLSQPMKLFYAWALNAHFSSWVKQDTTPRIRPEKYKADILSGVMCSRRFYENTEHPFDRNLWMPDYEKLITGQTCTALTNILDTDALIAGTRVVGYFPFPCSMEYWDKIIMKNEPFTPNRDRYTQLVTQWKAEFENKPLMTPEEIHHWLMNVRRHGFSGGTGGIMDVLGQEAKKIEDKDGSLVEQYMSLR